jgi:hypothetical protein
MRKHLAIFILSLFIFPSFSAKKPKTIEEAVHYLEKKWSKKDKETYKKLSEDDALAEMDNMDGVWIRNEWIRFCKDTTLRHTFHEMGITHADDMSDIILISTYRKLKGLPPDIPSQVKKCKDYWTPVRECEEKAAILSISNYDKFKPGDSITIFLYTENLVVLNGRTIPCPYSEDWSFDYKKDLIVKGIIMEKYTLYGDPYFKVQIASLDPEQAHIFYKRVLPGEIVEFPLKSLLVKQPPLQKALTKKIDKTY